MEADYDASGCLNPATCCRPRRATVCCNIRAHRTDQQQQRCLNSIRAGVFRGLGGGSASVAARCSSLDQVRGNRRHDFSSAAGAVAPPFGWLSRRRPGCSGRSVSQGSEPVGGNWLCWADVGEQVGQRAGRGGGLCRCRAGGRRQRVRSGQRRMPAWAMQRPADGIRLQRHGGPRASIGRNGPESARSAPAYRAGPCRFDGRFPRSAIAFRRWRVSWISVPAPFPARRGGCGRGLRHRCWRRPAAANRRRRRKMAEPAGTPVDQRAGHGQRPLGRELPVVGELRLLPRTGMSSVKPLTISICRWRRGRRRWARPGPSAPAGLPAATGRS